MTDETPAHSRYTRSRATALRKGLVSSGSAAELNAQKQVLHFSEAAPAEVENSGHNQKLL